MANQNAPFGLRATRRYDGAAPNFAIQELPIAYNNTTAIYQGDPVKLLASGYIDKAGTSDTRIKGVMQSVRYFDTALQKVVYGPAWLGVSTALQGSVYARVNVDPMTVYEVQSSGTAVGTADVGANATFVASTGNSLTQISNASLDQTSLNTTNTLPFRVVGLSPVGGNDNSGSYNVVEVMIVNNEITSTTGI